MVYLDAVDCRKREIHPSLRAPAGWADESASTHKGLGFSVSRDMREVVQDTGETVMAKLLVPYLFKWQDVEAKSDLERLRLVLEHLPDEGLMQQLEKHRKWGRDDYPIRAVWNSVLAGIVYQHESMDSLRRELLRNGELRDRCGFDPRKGAGAVPPPWVYTRFLKLLFRFRA
jgi:hypothetical protein